MRHTTTTTTTQCNSRDYHSASHTTEPQSYAMTVNDTALTSIACTPLPHSIVCVHAHTHTRTCTRTRTHTHTHTCTYLITTQCKLQSAPMCLRTLVHKWASWHRKHHHQCKLQVMTTKSANEVFALVEDRKTPYMGKYT